MTRSRSAWEESLRRRINIESAERRAQSAGCQPHAELCTLHSALCSLYSPSRRHLLVMLAQPDADDSGDARFLHGYTVDGVRGLHGARVVRDHDELGAPLELVQEGGEAAHVGVIQRRIHLVEQAEGAGFGE